MMARAARARCVSAPVRRPVGRARRLARDRGRGRARRSIPSATRSCRSAITTDGRVAARGRRAARCSNRAATRCPAAFAVDGDDGRARRPSRAAASSSRAVPARRSASTSCSRCCTARTARTARCRACSSSPTCPYVGSGVLGSAVGMDKIMMKRAFARRRAPARARTSRSATVTTVDAFVERGRGRARASRAS